MKKIVFTILVGFIFQQSHAQTRLSPGEMKIDRETFVVSKIPQFDSIKYIGIDSKKNKYNKGIPYSKEEKDRRFLPMDFARDIHVNNDSIKQIVYNVLNNKLAALKKNKESMNFIFKFEPSGKLTDIGFTLKENTLITIEEIGEIDQKLRNSITATFTGTQYKYYTAINYYKPHIVF